MEKSHVCWKYRKLQCTKGMIHGVVQKMSKGRGEEKVWTIALAEKLSEVWEQIGKSDRFNNSENINVCKKKTIWRFIRSKGYRRCEYRRKIRLREVNRKKRVTWCKEKTTVTISWLEKGDFFGREPDCDWKWQSSLYLQKRPMKHSNLTVFVLV